MAKYLVLDVAGVVIVAEGKNMKSAIEGLGLTDTVQVYRIAAGPVEVTPRTETVTLYDFGVSGKSWDNEEE